MANPITQPAYQVDNFIKAVGGGARPSLFAVVPGTSLDISAITGLFQNAQSALVAGDIVGALTSVTNVLDGGLNLASHIMLCKSSSFPSSELEDIGVKFRGRHAPIPGERKFGNWKCTFYMPPGHTSRLLYEAWHEGINGGRSNQRSFGGYSDIYKSFTIVQFNTLGNPSAAVEVHDAFPTSISEVALDWETNGIETFDATFVMQYWDRLPLTDIIGKVMDTATVITGGALQF